MIYTSFDLLSVQGSCICCNSSLLTSGPRYLCTLVFLSARVLPGVTEQRVSVPALYLYVGSPAGDRVYISILLLKCLCKCAIAVCLSR